MQTLGVFQAKNHLTALLDDVEDGDEVVITRRGKPIARLVSVHAGIDHAKGRKAAEGLRAASKGQTLGGLSLRDLVNEGRR